ncbi:hypothetical protein MUN84_08345 [Hymenobacter sp. 5516J-16]|uniref:hypothetical protein n=1 Tax=Hymenobacter sp. 5516J-16 TaxID=2932253 RepID=UPI001FD50434|nr:hypothetical protein [Hymenobacter sp. 5516J-16]UOQ78547.1 hypothetical protein MUN84_08345 [Hymenobacter sp. 5516J-16]
MNLLFFCLFAFTYYYLLFVLPTKIPRKQQLIGVGIALTAFALLIAPNICVGQRYTTASIRSKADSVLKSHIGADAFKYCSYEPHTYYEYVNLFGRTRWQRLNKGKRTKGRFVKIDMRYVVAIPYAACPAYDTISGQSSFKFNQYLRLVEPPYLDFVPDFYWQKQTCGIMSQAQAIAIAKAAGIKPGYKPVTAYLEYNPESKTFLWTVHSYLTVTSYYGKLPQGEVDVVIIDAIKGEPVSHTINYYGPVF